MKTTIAAAISTNPVSPEFIDDTSPANNGNDINKTAKGTLHNVACIRKIPLSKRIMIS